MCVEIKKDYMGLYFKFDEKMREYLINTDGGYTKIATVKQMQGYEMLRIAWIASNVDSNLTEDEMLETVKQNLSMETAKIEVERNKNDRDSTLQKMIEVVRSLGEDVSPLEFVRGL